MHFLLIGANVLYIFRFAVLLMLFFASCALVFVGHFQVSVARIFVVRIVFCFFVFVKVEEVVVVLGCCLMGLVLQLVVGV